MAMNKNARATKEKKILWLLAEKELWDDLEALAKKAISSGLYSKRSILGDVKCSLNAILHNEGLNSFSDVK